VRVLCHVCAHTGGRVSVREREVYSKGPRVGGPQSSAAWRHGSPAWLCSPATSCHHLYAVTTLTSLSCCELYSNNYTNFETGSERKTAQWFTFEKNLEIGYYYILAQEHIIVWKGRPQAKRGKSMTRIWKKSDNNLLSLAHPYPPLRFFSLPGHEFLCKLAHRTSKRSNIHWQHLRKRSGGMDNKQGSLPSCLLLGFLYIDVWIFLCLRTFLRLYWLVFECNC
jgi:hypothetical protein